MFGDTLKAKARSPTFFISNSTNQMNMYLSCCMAYIGGIFYGWDKSKMHQTSKARKIWGAILVIVGILLTISRGVSMYLIYKAYGYKGDTIEFNRIMFIITILCGWGLFLMISSKPFRDLWRRISIPIVFFIWTLILLLGINPHPFSELGIAAASFVAMAIMYYLKGVQVPEKSNVRRI